MPSLPQYLDLHLIRILYLLLVEKNVSRVALKLNQPQPSISVSLRKLRELTGAPLLVSGTRQCARDGVSEMMALLRGRAEPAKEW